MILGLEFRDKQLKQQRLAENPSKYPAINPELRLKSHGLILSRLGVACRHRRFPAVVSPLLLNISAESNDRRPGNTSLCAGRIWKTFGAVFKRLSKNPYQSNNFDQSKQDQNS